MPMRTKRLVELRDRNSLVNHFAVRVLVAPIVQANAAVPRRSAKLTAEAIVELPFLGKRRPRPPALFLFCKFLGSHFLGETAELDFRQQSDGHQQCDGKNAWTHE